MLGADANGFGLENVSVNPTYFAAARWAGHIYVHADLGIDIWRFEANHDTSISVVVCPELLLTDALS